MGHFANRGRLEVEALTEVAQVDAHADRCRQLVGESRLQGGGVGGLGFQGRADQKLDGPALRVEPDIDREDGFARDGKGQRSG